MCSASRGSRSERVLEEVDLPDGEIVRGPPQAMQALELFLGHPHPLPRHDRSQQERASLQTDLGRCAD